MWYLRDLGNMPRIITEGSGVGVGTFVEYDTEQESFAFIILGSASSNPGERIAATWERLIEW